MVKWSKVRVQWLTRWFESHSSRFLRSLGRVCRPLLRLVLDISHSCITTTEESFIPAKGLVLRKARKIWGIASMTLLSSR